MCGKIKKEKALLGITEDEIPFEIPNNWKWVRLGDICSKIASGSTPTGGKKSNVYVDDGYCLFREQNVYNDGIHKEGLVYITEELLNSRTNSKVLPMDILLNITGGSIGRCALIPQNFTKGSVNQHILIIRLIDLSMRFYIHYCLCSPYVQKYIKGKVVGDKDGFSGARCKNMLIPLPPLSEQMRIVDKIDAMVRVLNLIDELQSSYTADMEVLKSKLIDAGIQGKLTERLSEDGDVEVLYERLKEEKKTILKSRKGREDKNIKRVEDDIPYELPKNWKWVRLGEVGLFKKGPFGSALTKSMFIPKSEEAVKVYEQQHAIRKDASLGTYYISRQYFDEKMSGFEVESGDIIISCAGTIGETYILPEEIEQGIINQALMRVVLVDSVDKEFFRYYFDANLKKMAQNESNGSAIKNFPPFDVMKNWYFPLTSLEEQRRIVEKLNQLLNIV
jgi:type I restriction enzyme S subunit